MKKILRKKLRGVASSSPCTIFCFHYVDRINLYIYIYIYEAAGLEDALACMCVCVCVCVCVDVWLRRAGGHSTGREIPSASPSSRPTHIHIRIDIYMYIDGDTCLCTCAIYSSKARYESD